MSRGFKNFLYIILGMIVLASATYILAGNSITSLFEDFKNTMLNSLSFEFNSEKGWFTENGEEIKTLVNFKHTEGINILNDETITFDDDVVEVYQDMYTNYYAVRYQDEKYKVNKDELLLNNELYYLIQLSSDDGNLVIAAKIIFDSDEETNEGITKEYIEGLYVEQIEIYIPNDKLGKYIDIATITHDGIEIKNSNIYSIYKLYEMNGHQAVQYVNHYNDGMRTSLISASSYVYEVIDEENKKETIPCDWKLAHEKIADSIFVDLFTITYTEELKDETKKIMQYDDDWADELKLKEGRYYNIYEDDPYLLSALKCRALNYYYESNNDPGGRNLILQFGLFDTSKLKSRTYHLLIDIGDSQYDGFKFEDNMYKPVEDEFERIELYEIVDGVYKKIVIFGSYWDTEYYNAIKNCVYNYDLENAYLHVDTGGTGVEMHTLDGTNVSDWDIVALNEYDIPSLIFEKIFYYQ